MNESNPYRTPVSGSPQTQSQKTSGLIWLVSGFLMLIVAVVVVGYLMILVVPDIVRGYKERGVALRSDFVSSIRLIDFLVHYWLVWPVLIVVALGAVEVFVSAEKRPMARKRFGVALGLLALSLSTWMILVTFLAAN